MQEANKTNSVLGIEAADELTHCKGRGYHAAVWPLCVCKTPLGTPVMSLVDLLWGKYKNLF